MQGSKTQTRKLLLFIALSLTTGFIWGKAITQISLPKEPVQRYTSPEIPVGEFDEMASVDVIRNGDGIWVVDHYTGHLIFEYNRFKEVDKEAFGEYEDVLAEMASRK